MRRYKRPVTILKAARNLIADGHWTRLSMSRWTDGGTCYCALGALDAVTKYEPEEMSADPYMRLRYHDGASEAVELLAKSVHDPAKSDDPQVVVMNYNDHRARGRSNVVKLFDRAIARAEGSK